MTALYITRGLPGSGKTTWALYECSQFARVGAYVARISRDDLRVQLYGPRSKDYYDHPDLQEREAEVTRIQHERIRLFLSAGVSVIVDDTNLPVRRCRELMRIAEECGAYIEEIRFDNVPLSECIERQASRPERDRVDEAVIRRMHSRYFPLAPLPEKSGLSPKTHDYSVIEPVVERDGCDPAIIVDIDGTLALMSGRGPHDYHLVGTDRVNVAVARIVDRVASYPRTKTFLVSGRKDDCREETEQWLYDNGIFYDELYMRKTGDDRTDWIVKYEIFNEHIRDKYNVIAVFDDRDQVVKMWRTLGLTCFQVAEGDF